MHVEIPNEEFVTPPIAPESLETLAASYKLPPEVLKLAQEAEAKLDRVRNAPLPADEDLPLLSQKKRDRIEAFSMCDEIRSLR